MRFGHYDDDACEYVITTPDTPLPWINYLGSQDFFSLISHRGGGYSFYRDARLRRLTRFRYASVPADNDGRYLFLNDGGDVWTPTSAPVRAALDAFECRHGLGYSTITGERGGVRAQTTYFVPLDATCEVQHVRLTNTSGIHKHLTAFSYVEWCLWDALDDMLNLQRNLSLAELEVEDSTIYHRTEYRERRNHYAFYGVNAPVAGFDTDRDAFIGGPWGSLASAAVPRAGRPGNSLASGWYPIASHCLDVPLAPGETREFVFVLGYAENPDDAKWESPGVIRKDGARALLARFATPAQAEAELDRLKAYWRDLLGQFHVDSSDPALNRGLNVWNQYQCLVTFNLSRSASYFETGIGRGIGFRDSNQDLLGIVAMVPQRARARILDLAATQFVDGSAYHQYSPLTKRGNHDLGSGFNDDPLWLIWGTCAYVAETGDTGILDEPVPFDNDESLAAPLLEHLVASWRHVVDNLGPHGLPLIGRADWNDCLNLNAFTSTPGESFQTTVNREGRIAESVFIAGLFTATAPALADLLDRRGEAGFSARLRDSVTAMHAAIRDHGWDGAWFRRAYDALGDPVGSAGNEEGRIFIEPQGMCVIGGAGVHDGRARAALDSVAERLAGEHGIALVAPPYTRYHLELGEISSYPPGYKENGGVFCHNNPWIIMAEAIAGSPERAFDYYKRIAPAYR
ncbi:MAG: glycosyl transferase, partial [Actinomycetia bacterium]|nr:glycosyl transferase [Actinomycetes bacterium]